MELKGKGSKLNNTQINIKEIKMNIIIENGTERTNEIPKVKASIKAGGNVKLGSSIGTFSKLMGNSVYYIPEYDVEVKGSCGEFCKNCDKDCYVKKSYRRYTNSETGECSVIKGHAKNTIAFYTDLHQSFFDLHMQLTRKKAKFVFVRIDQSGEITSTKEYLGWAWLASLHPETVFYVYTKAFVYVLDALLEGKVPRNLITLFSVWHEYGIREFTLVAHLENVKAFAYCDERKPNGWCVKEYAAHGLIIQTFCPAYDEKGKMNHDLPCEKCKKCMNYLKSCKVIGCHDH